MIDSGGVGSTGYVSRLIAVMDHAARMTNAMGFSQKESERYLQALRLKDALDRDWTNSRIAAECGLTKRRIQDFKKILKYQLAGLEFLHADHPIVILMHAAGTDGKTIEELAEILGRSTADAWAYAKSAVKSGHLRVVRKSGSK